VTSLRGKVGRWIKLMHPRFIDWITKKSVEAAYRD
jgi:hypothetical protein